jgi:hypothetical protein
MLIFEFESAACCNKSIQKTSIPTNVWHFLFCQGFSKDYLKPCTKSEELTWYTFLFQPKKTWIKRVKDTAKLHGFTLKTQLNWKPKQVRFFYKTDWVMNQAEIIITVVWTEQIPQKTTFFSGNKTILNGNSFCIVFSTEQWLFLRYIITFLSKIQNRSKKLSN